MSNFLEGLGNILKHPIDEVKWMWDETERVGKNVLRGDFGEAFDEFKGSFGRHNEMMSENITVPLFGRNKLSENPDAVAGAVIGGIMAAPAIGSAVGGGGTSFYPGGGMFQGNTAAPVVDAVGQSPMDAVLAGGGNASEVGSISPSDTSSTMKRMGNVINQMGGDLMSNSGPKQVRQAPAFKPSFRPIQTQGFGSDVMAQIGAQDYNLKL